MAGRECHLLCPLLRRPPLSSFVFSHPLAYSLNTMSKRAETPSDTLSLIPFCHSKATRIFPVRVFRITINSWAPTLDLDIGVGVPTSADHKGRARCWLALRAPFSPVVICRARAVVLPLSPFSIRNVIESSV